MPDSSILCTSNTILTNSITPLTPLTGSITTTDTLIANPYYGGAYLTYTDVASTSNPLQNLNYNSKFLIKDKSQSYLLENNIKKIKNNKIYFNCDFHGNRIQPYEFIMKLIEEKEKFSLSIKISDILKICYTNFQFLEIENNLNFNDTCDFSVLKVKFSYDKVLYENKKLSQKELRTDKLKKIMRENV